MAKIEFAEGLSLPVEIATATTAMVAMKGQGKSFAADKLIEGLVSVNVQVLLIDPAGRHYGLRLAADGKGAGLDIIVVGGLRGDVPLDAHHGGLVAEMVINSGRNFLLDVSQLSVRQRKLFVAAFGERLWALHKAKKDPQPLHIVLEEAHLFLPEMKSKDVQEMVETWTEIVRLGRNYGIGVTLITQRPQSVTKEALSQVECLIVFQLNGALEKKAIRDSIVEKELSVDLVKELPFVKRGEPFIWSPGLLEHFGRHRILPKWTFDGSATPKVGVKRKQVALKPLDLTVFKEQMAGAVKQLEQNDPSALKRRVAELEQQLGVERSVAAKAQASVAPIIKVKTVTVSIKDELKLLNKALDGLAHLGDQLAQKQQVVVTTIDNALQVLSKANTPEGAEAFETLRVRGKMHAPRGERHVVAGPVVAYSYGVGTSIKTTAKTEPLSTDPLAPAFGGPAPASNASASTKLAKGARDMLNMLAWKSPLSRGQLATLAVLAPSGGTFSTYLSKLRTMGYAEENGDRIAITDAGRDVAEMPSQVDIVTMWKSKLPGKSKDMLDAVMQRTHNRGSLATHLGLEASGGTFNTYLSKLRSNGLIEERDGSITPGPGLTL